VILGLSRITLVCSSTAIDICAWEVSSRVCLDTELEKSAACRREKESFQSCTNLKYRFQIQILFRSERAYRHNNLWTRILHCSPSYRLHEYSFLLKCQSDPKTKPRIESKRNQPVRIELLTSEKKSELDI
jgi:hypothetical protein